MTVAEHLQNLIRIPSVSAISNRPVIDYATAVLHTIGWTTRELSYTDPNGIEKVNLIAVPPQQDASTRNVDLAFVCHTDTVPYANDWPHAIDPFIADGLLHGCGACDVKGFLACLLSTASSCEGRYIDGLRIVLSSDEEIGCIGAKHLRATDAIRARRMIIGEPTSLHVARAGKGYCLARLSFTGREAHSAHPGKGVSAIFAAARMIASLEALSEELKQQCNNFFSPPFTTLNIGTIQGGTAKNIIPAYCEFLVEWRPIPTASSSEDRVLTAIHKLVANFTADDPSFSCRVDLLRQQSGFETPSDSPLVKFIEDKTARPATSIPFGSEASIFASITEDIVVIGPGDMRSAHSNRECVPLTELDEAVEMMAALMSIA